MISREYSICGFRVYIYIRNCNICKFKNVKNPQFFVPGIFYLWGSRIYIYIRNCISHCRLNIIFYLWISRIYIYIRKTVMLNHVYQIHNCEILAFNILSVDPRFFNILTSSPLLYIVACLLIGDFVFNDIKPGELWL